MTSQSRSVLLLHNPGAGDENHTAEAITASLQGAGYSVTYYPATKKGWIRMVSGVETIVIAGGDGTVRKAVKALLDAGLDSIPKLAVLPLGTANNIANALYGTEDHDEIIAGWSGGKAKPFDLAWIEGLPQTAFFIESLGYGVFPALMRTMKLVDDLFSDQPELRLDLALGLMAGIIRSYKPVSYSIQIDGQDHSGDYLLVEVMNIGSFGPNLELPAGAVPGDGTLDVVMIPESGRQQLLDYISSKIRGESGSAAFAAIKGRTVEITAADKRMHVDDKLIRNKYAGLNIELEVGRLQFLGEWKQ